MKLLLRVIAGLVVALPWIAPSRAEPLCDLDLPPPLPAAEAAAGAPIEVSSASANVSRAGRARLEGSVEISQGERRVRADAAEYDDDTGRFDVEGNVEYRDSSIIVHSREAHVERDGGAELAETSFELPSRPARGSAARIVVDPGGTLQLDAAEYTTCRRGDDDWLLSAGRIRLDPAAGTASGRNVWLRFGDVPLAYLPYISFPITDARKTGVLLPDLSGSDRSGASIAVPVYWNIAPSYDATFTPAYLSKRGAQLISEFRYLTARSRGQIDLELLPDDDLSGDDRDFARLFNQSDFTDHWRFTSRLSSASDSGYFEDFGQGQEELSLTHLERNLEFTYLGQHVSALARVQNYQTIDSRIALVDRPYERLPQLLMAGQWSGPAGMAYGWHSELVNFERDVGVTGQRLDIRPDVSWPLAAPGYFVIPNLAWQYTQYALADTAPGEDEEPSRTAPIASLDAGLVLERDTGAWLHTLEPRALYVHVPFREQSALPVFDTGLPDFNLVQLFRRDRFVGPDRLGDTDQISVGVTSRLFDRDSGRQILAATIGQRYILSDQIVTLPDTIAAGQDSSDLIAELELSLHDHWNADLGLQWNPDDSVTERAELRLQYRRAARQVINLAYRFRRQEVEQSDFSFAWPVSERWSVVGRFNYSFREETTLDRFAGVEYQSCCWGLRLISRRFVSTRTGGSDSAIFLQLELKGLTSVGDRADLLLDRAILGYSDNTSYQAVPLP